MLRAPLEGTLVLDLSRILAGPSCTQFLADHGARVIKVERPGGGDESRQFGPPFVGDVSVYFLSCNRGKESIAVDMKSERGFALVRELMAQADVLVSNFRPGVLEGLGLGWEACHEANPRLVMGTLSGYGASGLPEWCQRGAYDVVMQGMGGIPSVTGHPDGPPMKVGASIADLVAGLHLGQGILLALLERERTGRGSHVEVSMQESQASLLTYLAGHVLNAGLAPRRLGNRHPNVAPYCAYEVADGWMNLAVPNDLIWARFCAAIDRPQLVSDARFESNPERVRNVDELDAILEPILRERSLAEWVEHLDEARVPCGPILTVPQVLAHPQLAARGFVLEQEHPTLGAVRGMASPVMVGPGRSAPLPPPRFAEHTEAVLRELLALETDEIAELDARGVVERAR
jgi:crotonobetainyl-CoA:carnitine CoA-transferase CaiB-like acyl-CoA transferase